MKDETIWTESSHKYRAGDITEMAETKRFPFRRPMARFGMAVCGKPADCGLGQFQ